MHISRTLHISTTEALAIDITELADLLDDADLLAIGITDVEHAALVFLRYCYHSADVLLDALELTGDRCEEVVMVRPAAIARALLEDGTDRVPCLSDHTGLQRICWAIGPASC